MYKQISIDNEVVNVVKVKAIQNNGAWLNIYVDNKDNIGTPVACHTLPKTWFDNNEKMIVKTGGKEYKKGLFLYL